MINYKHKQVNRNDGKYYYQFRTTYEIKSKKKILEKKTNDRKSIVQVMIRKTLSKKCII